MIFHKKIVCRYLGMMLVAILLCDNESLCARENWRKAPNGLIFLSAIMDVAANVLCMAGLYMIGSGLYQVGWVVVIGGDGNNICC